MKKHPRIVYNQLIWTFLTSWNISYSVYSHNFSGKSPEIAILKRDQKLLFESQKYIIAQYLQSGNGMV